MMTSAQGLRRSAGRPSAAEGSGFSPAAAETGSVPGQAAMTTTVTGSNWCGDALSCAVYGMRQLRSGRPPRAGAGPAGRRASGGYGNDGS